MNRVALKGQPDGAYSVPWLWYQNPNTKVLDCDLACASHDAQYERTITSKGLYLCSAAINKEVAVTIDNVADTQSKNPQ